MYPLFSFRRSLREVSMDIAINDVTNQSRATSVEQCACPLEYQGFSCEVSLSYFSNIPPRKLDAKSLPFKCDVLSLYFFQCNCITCIIDSY